MASETKCQSPSPESHPCSRYKAPWTKQHWSDQTKNSKPCKKTPQRVQQWLNWATPNEAFVSSCRNSQAAPEEDACGKKLRPLSIQNIELFDLSPITGPPHPLPKAKGGCFSHHWAPPPTSKSKWGIAFPITGQPHPPFSVIEPEKAKQPKDILLERNVDNLLGELNLCKSAFSISMRTFEIWHVSNSSNCHLPNWHVSNICEMAGVDHLPKHWSWCPTKNQCQIGGC